MVVEVALLLCSFAGTAQIEQNFAVVELHSKGRKAGTTVEHLKSEPRVETHVARAMPFVLQPAKLRS